LHGRWFEHVLDDGFVEWFVECADEIYVYGECIVGVDGGWFEWEYGIVPGDGDGAEWFGDGDELRDD
jgi:hypothetical protein